MENGRPSTDAWGISDGHWGTDGDWHETAPETRAALRRSMGSTDGDEGPPNGHPVWVVPTGWGETLLSPCQLVLESGDDLGVVEKLSPDLPIGRHRLAPVDGGPTTLLIVRPRRCVQPPDRAVALAVQVYAARSEASWGIGDLRDLRMLGAWAASNDVDLLATSPLHAPSPGTVPQPSPYYPSSRRFLSPLHITVDEVAGADRDEKVALLATEARGLLAERRIDREAVWAAKLPALKRLFDARGTAIDAEIESFRTRGGDDLQRWATYCAIAEAHPAPWPEWPSELRHPSNPAVARFAADHNDRVRFHAWLQWVADRQLHQVADVCPLIADLAVGVDPGGADAWSDQDMLALDARIGAPPDEFAADGQDWGLPPSIPHALRADGYESFARTIRANMRNGGGIRIDHVLGLFRTYWIPSDGDPARGAYVRSNAEELLAVLAIESERAGTFVVGEDLGTVGPGVRETLAANGVLGTRLVYFEDDPPEAWRSNVLGAATTHDLPTIAGVWTGADRRQREEAGLSADGTEQLRETVRRIAGESPDVEGAICAVHEALAASPADIVVGNLDDVLAVEERPNMPGTIDEWPNWSIALPTSLDDLVDGPAPATLRALTERRSG
ncbi:MAG: 4-alpha-glucanotransferase [Acidimicrobiales bacterium]